MFFNSLIAFAAALLCVALASAVFVRERQSVASWAFFVGMWVLALESFLGGLALRAISPGAYAYWQASAWMAKSLLPVSWLAFSLTYSRGNSHAFLKRWGILLILAAVIPGGLAIGFGEALLEVWSDASNGLGWLAFSGPAKILNVLFLITSVLVLTNLEKTFRSAVGTMQWRIKFMVLGVGVIFGAQIYTRSQALLFSGQDLSANTIEAAAILIGCGLMTVAYLRSGFGGVEVYPSRVVLQSSITLLLVGAYLFIVGVLAQVVAAVGGMANFQLQALLVLGGVVLLAVLLLSRRVRRAIQLLVSRHFRRPQHDACAVWTRLTQSLARLQDQNALCQAAIKLISETFSVLSVAFWLVDERSEQLRCIASTSQAGSQPKGARMHLPYSESFRSGMQGAAHPFDLEAAKGEWAEHLRASNAPQFRHGGNQMAIPLRSGDRVLGIAVLADRVNGVPYAAEELDLLRCIGDQVAAALLNFRLANALTSAKELEAFQTMSTFFVHDLKNATAGLNLMLKNLPVHFDDPAFREDALRGVANTVNRIDSLITRLSSLRNKFELRLAECDLNGVVNAAVSNLHGLPEIEVVKELRELPGIIADREQMESVVTNLLLNARDAIGSKGQIRVETMQTGGRAILSVADNGCGMSAAFLRDSLFRPFQTTKKKGIGIGMFQSRMIVEAHHGALLVESEPGAGSTFRVILPLKSER